MKVIVVSQRVDSYLERNEKRDALDSRLIKFLLLAGFMPVPMPNGMYQETTHGSFIRDDFDAWLAVIKPQGVLLSGGNDIGKLRERDLTENWLLDHAKLTRLPALGICRGMQMMGVWAGAELKDVSGHVGTHHQINGEITGVVNSYHHQALVDCPTGFNALARSEDGELEAIRHEDLLWEGWMWHPERESQFFARDIERIKTLFI